MRNGKKRVTGLHRMLDNFQFLYSAIRDEYQVPRLACRSMFFYVLSLLFFVLSLLFVLSVHFFLPFFCGLNWDTTNRVI